MFDLVKNLFPVLFFHLIRSGIQLFRNVVRESMTDFDAIIVGASVAGASTAAWLGKSGYHVLLLEKAIFPRVKVCGEGLMPAGVRILDRLGVLPQLQQQGTQLFSGIQFYSTEGQALELDFNQVSATTRGVIIPRVKLDSLLAKHAGKLSGVVLREAFRVSSAKIGPGRVEVEGHGSNQPYRYSARLLIAADGIRSKFHRQFKIHRRPPRFRRFALRTYYPYLRDCRPVVEVHSSPVGEAYVAPLGGNQVLLTLLLSTSPRIQTSLFDLYFESLKHFPQLRQRLRDPTPRKRIEATGPLASRLSRCHGDRLLFVGDAGGAVDPVTGQGITLALKDAELAAEVLEYRLGADQLSEKDLRVYTEQRNRYFLSSYELAESLLSTFRHPFLARRVLRSLSSNRSLARKALEAAADLRPTFSLCWKDRIQLVLGV